MEEIVADYQTTAHDYISQSYQDEAEGSSLASSKGIDSKLVRLTGMLQLKLTELEGTFVAFF